MEKLIGEPLPALVHRIASQVNNIEKLLLEKNENSKPLDADEILTVKQAAEFLSLSIQTIYGLISRNELPVMKRSKRCYFSKGDLIKYLQAGKREVSHE